MATLPLQDIKFKTRSTEQINLNQTLSYIQNTVIGAPKTIETTLSEYLAQIHPDLLEEIKKSKADTK